MKFQPYLFLMLWCDIPIIWQYSTLPGHPQHLLLHKHPDPGYTGSPQLCYRGSSAGEHLDSDCSCEIADTIVTTSTQPQLNLNWCLRLKWLNKKGLKFCQAQPSSNQLQLGWFGCVSINFNFSLPHPPPPNPRESNEKPIPIRLLIKLQRLVFGTLLDWWLVSQWSTS